MTVPTLLPALTPALTASPIVTPTHAGGAFSLVWLVIALPAAGAALLLLGGRLTVRWGHLIGTATSVGSFVVSLVLFLQLRGRADDDRQVGQHLWNWIEVGHLHVGFDLLYDQLTALFLLLITGVGSLIHIYSIGYMAHDPRRRRFFAYLNLFVAAMLTLVMSGNYLGLFLGWEGVGLASYLLIGFWQHKPSAAAAAKKAFVINRIGDMGMVSAIFLAFVMFGSTDFSVISRSTANAPHDQMTALGVLLLVGACGKSAQFPLQAWLLDAMEGPTPVSALIHAATMVTAGVYLVVRSNFVFDYAPHARTVVIVIATITLLYGAWIGCAKDDIKKALAGSTMSQIGYMMLGAGLGPAGYAFAIFHLLTHGFFKANMFLGAGSVMHGMDDDVDMRHYGALRKAMPVTFLTFAMGYLAIIGFPGFSGFWSKDKIIEAALADNWLVGVCAILGAGVTGFYMTRLMLMTYLGRERWLDGVHPHESPAVMTGPLVMLAALSALGGLLLAGHFITDWLTPVVGPVEEQSSPIPSLALSGIVVVVVAVGVATAFVLFGRREVPATAPSDVSPVTRAGRAELYGNDVNDALVVNPGRRLVTGLLFFDRYGADGVMSGGPIGLAGVGQLLRRTQSGYVRSYALSVLGGVVVVVLALLAVNI